MKWMFRILAFLGSFGVGLNTPVLSLLLCEHGCTVQNLGMAAVAFSVTVVAAELPTGVFADLYGRKRAFLVAQAAGLLSAGVLFAADSFWMAAFGLCLMGLSTAFASGSLDALAVEDTLRRGGDAALTKCVSQLMACQCAGLAGGALAGGLLPYASGYAVHLAVRAAVCIAAAILAVRLPAEQRADVRETAPSLKGLMRQVRGAFAQSMALRSLAAGIVCIAVVQFALETYWQIRLTDVLAGRNQALLGVLSAAAFLATTGGCLLMGRIRLDGPRRSWAVYAVLGVSFALLIAGLSFAANAVAFSALYIACYLLLGMISVSEQTIANREAPDSVRASLLSVTSLAARGGGILSGMMGTALLTAGDIGLVWRVTALIAVLGLAAASAGWLRRGRARGAHGRD